VNSSANVTLWLGDALDDDNLCHEGQLVFPLAEVYSGNMEDRIQKDAICIKFASI